MRMSVVPGERRSGEETLIFVPLGDAEFAATSQNAA